MTWCHAWRLGRRVPWVVFVWLSHTGDEFSIMDPSLLELARQALLHS